MAFSYSSSTGVKYSYLDGVPFGINPLFVIDDPSDDEHERSRSKDNKNRPKLNSNFNIDRALNYNLNKATSIVNCKYDFLAETTLLLTEKIIKKQQKKTKHDEKQQSINKDSPMPIPAKINRNNPNESESNSPVMKPINIHKTNGFSSTSSSNISFSSSPSNHLHNLDFTSETGQNSNTILSSSTGALTSNSTLPHINFSNNIKLLEPERVQKQPAKFELNNNTNNKNNNNNNNNNTNDKNLTKDLFSFDSLSLDPFNDMELKTINDIEELRTILNNHQFVSQPLQTEQVLPQQGSTPPLSQLPHQQLNESTIRSSQKQQSTVTSNWSSSLNMFDNTNSPLCAVDNFGLPKLPMVDLDLLSKK